MFAYVINIKINYTCSIGFVCVVSANTASLTLVSGRLKVKDRVGIAGVQSNFKKLNDGVNFHQAS